jgi:hypothetical protein
MLKYLPLLLVLISCASVGDKAYYVNPSPMFSYQSPLGIKTVFIDNAESLDIKLVDEYYKLISICVANKVVKQDFLIITHEKMYDEGKLIPGITIFYTDSVPEIHLSYPKGADQIEVFIVLAHEMVHVILQTIGEPIEDNINHVSEAFRCAT